MYRLTWTLFSNLRFTSLLLHSLFLCLSSLSWYEHQSREATITLSIHFTCIMFFTATILAVFATILHKREVDLTEKRKDTARSLGRNLVKHNLMQNGQYIGNIKGLDTTNWLSTHIHVKQSPEKCYNMRIGWIHPNLPTWFLTGNQPVRNKQKN